MMRMAVSIVLGFILVVLESFIVMKLKGNQTIEFGEVAPFINVWAVNFFLAYSILTQMMNWFETITEKKRLNQEN